MRFFHFLFALILLLPFPAFSRSRLSSPVLPAVVAADEFVDVELVDVPSSAVVGLLYREVIRAPFVTSQDVEKDRSLISVHVFGKRSVVASQISALLASQGYVLRLVGGLSRVEIAPKPEAPKEVKPPLFPHIYRPSWRSPSSLSTALKDLFPDARFSSGSSFYGGSSSLSSSSLSSSSSSFSGSSYGSLSREVSEPSDVLAYRSTRADASAIASILPQLDTPVGEVMVKAYVLEAHNDRSDGSTFQTAVNLLQSDFKLSYDLHSTMLTLKNTAIQAVVRSLNNSNRFVTVASPSLRARSGTSASFVVGQQVPVIGSVSYSGNGSSSTPVQSVDYRDAGVILSVNPVIHDRVIDVSVSQEVSAFIPTTTGVNSTPTLTKRALTSSLGLHDGDVVILGGLGQREDQSGGMGLSLLPFLRGSTQVKQHTDLLLVLQVIRLDDGLGSPTASETAVRASVPPPAPIPLRPVPKVPGAY